MANKTEIKAEPGKLDLFITREFDAPREAVFNAFVDPDILVKWLGPRNLKMTIEKAALASGEAYRFVHSDDQGNKFGFNGVCHYMAKPELIIRTFEFEGLPERGHVSLESATFEDLGGGRTRVVGHSVFMSVEDRDGMIASGMERGVDEGYERLDEVLGSGKTNSSAA